MVNEWISVNYLAFRGHVHYSQEAGIVLRACSHRRRKKLPKGNESTPIA